MGVIHLFVRDITPAASATCNIWSQTLLTLTYITWHFWSVAICLFAWTTTNSCDACDILCIVSVRPWRVW